MPGALPEEFRCDECRGGPKMRIRSYPVRERLRCFPGRLASVVEDRGRLGRDGPWAAKAECAELCDAKKTSGSLGTGSGSDAPSGGFPFPGITQNDVSADP